MPVAFSVTVLVFYGSALKLRSPIHYSVLIGACRLRERGTTGREMKGNVS